jgi:hypothetical protein
MADFLSTLFGGGAEAEAADKNRQLAAQYQTNSLDALKQTYGQGTDYLKSGVAAYDPLASLGAKYGQAGDLWMGALGAGGPTGTANATAAFQTTPGYALTQKAALDAIDRRRAIGGMYASGNADIDTGDWITKNLYETQYAPWMAGLQSAAGMGESATAAAAGGQAAGYGALSNLASQYGQNQTGVYGNFMNTNVGANNQQAAGEAQGARNLLGAGLGLASIAGGGGMFSGLSNMASNIFAPTQNSTPWQFPMATAGGNWGRPAPAYG